MLSILVKRQMEVGGVYGQMFVGDEFFCVTLEPRWRGNEVRVSCIPVGVYRCKRRNSSKFGTVYEVMEVPNRTAILLGHVGNYPKDTEGCFLFGEGYLFAGGKLEGISGSKAAVARFKGLVESSDSAILTIRWESSFVLR